MNKMIKSLLMMALAVFVGKAFAADTVAPVATWTNFNNDPEGYTLTKAEGCKVNDDGSITLGGAGLSLSLDESPVTVVMEVSNLPFGSDFILINYELSSGNHISLFNWWKNNQLEQWWNENKYTNNETTGNAVWSASGEERRTVAVTYAKTGGTTTYVNGNLLYNNSSLVQGNHEVTKIYIGSLQYGVRDYKNSNMKVHSLRIYKKKLTDAEVAQEMVRHGLVKAVYSIAGEKWSPANPANGSRIEIDFGNSDVKSVDLANILGDGVTSIASLSVTGENRGDIVLSTGELTLAGENTATGTLKVGKGATLNLSGSWNGNVEVSGTIKGAGRIYHESINNNGILKMQEYGVLDVSSGALTANQVWLSATPSTVTVELPENAAAGTVVVYCKNPQESALIGDLETKFSDQGFKFVSVEENGYKAIKIAAAQIGDTKYATLDAAVTAATEGQTITLISDVKLAETLSIPEGKEVTLDLNGKTVSMEESVLTTVYAINNLGTLTLKDSVGTGSINARGIYNGYGNGGANVFSAKLIVESGTYNAKGSNGGAAIFNYGIVEINGGTFTSVGGYSLNNQSGASMTVAGATANNGIYNTGATLTINSGNISGNRSGCHVIYAWNSNVTINGGTIHNNNSGNSTVMAAGSSSVDINDGKFTINIVDASSSYLLDAQNTASYDISGGTFAGGIRAQGGTTYNISGGTYTNEYGNYNVYTGGNIDINGGTFASEYAKTFASSNVAEGYELNADGAVVKSTVYVAEVNGVQYESLQAAIDAAANDAIVILLADIVLTEGVALSEEKAITLDLNDKTITLDVTGKTNPNDIYAISTLKGELTIKDSGTKGHIKGVVYTEATTVIENGTFSAADGMKYTILNNGGNMTFNGGTVNSGASYAIYSYGNGHSLTINDVKVNGYNGCLYLYNEGNVTINGGEIIYAPVKAETRHIIYTHSNANIVINGGTFKKEGGVDVSGVGGGGIYLAKNAQITIYHGVFNGANGDINYAAPADKPATALIYGGTFSSDVSAYVADGYKQNEDGTVVPAPTQIEVDTLDELLAALADNSNVLPIVITAQIVIPAGETVVLDLNGKTVTSVYQDNSTTKHIYPLNVYGNLTIDDTKGNGSISGRGIFVQSGSKLTVDGGSIYAIDSNGGSALWMYGGDVVINGGHIEQKAEGTYNFAINALAGTVTVNGGWVGGNHGAIAAGGAAVVINGGELVCTGTAGITDNVLYTYDTGSITINGGAFVADNDGPAGGCCVYDANGGVTINGGTFGNSSGGDVWGATGTTIKGGQFENLTETQHIAPGYELNENGEVKQALAKPIASVNGVEYTDLVEALAAAQNGDTIVLLSDLEVIGETFTIAADKAITLDMNGKKITATDNKAANVSYELFYIYGGLTVTGTGTIELISTSNDTAWAKSSTIFHNRGGVLTIENGSFTHKGGTAMAYVVDNNANSYGDAYLYVNGGEIISENYIAIRMRMEDPNANGNPGNGISYAAVSGGYIYGANRGIWGQKSSGANEKQGELTVTGGVVENGRADRGAIQIDVDSYEAQNMLVSISGSATIKGAIMGGDDEFVVSGGTFTVEVPEKYCAAGYKVEANQDGTFGVVVDPAYGKVAQIGDQYYATLAEALAAAQGGTVKLLADVTLDAVIAIEKVITLDLNGYTVTGANKAVVFQIKADTTIVNGKIVGNKTGTSSGLLEIYANLNMNGVTVETSSIKAMAFKEGGFTAVLTDCTVTGGLKGYGASVWQIYGGTYYVGSSASSEHLNGTVEVYGGTFHYELRSKDCAPGYEVVDNGDGTWTVAYNPACFVDTNNNGVLDDGEAIYGSLDEIFETLRSGDVYIVLLRDVEVGKQVDTNVNAKYYLNAAEDVTVTFKHETGVLSGDVAASEQAWNFIQNMYIGENVTLNAKYMLLWGDVEIAGTVNTTYLYALGATVDVLSTGKVNVNSGEATVQVKTNTTFTVDGELNTTLLQVWTENAKLIINGEVSARTIRAWDENPSIVVANDATVNAKFNLSDNASVQGPAGLDITTDVADHKIAYENGEYKIVERVYVAQIGDVKYESLAEAFKAGGDIILLNDVVVTATIKVERNTTVTLDLNGKTIDGTVKVRIAIMSYGDLTIKDSSEEKTGVVKAGIDTAGNCVNICAGSFTLESGNIYSLNNGILIDEEAATVTVNGGKITAEPGTNNSAAFYISSASETIVNIAGGELVGYNGILLWNNTKLNITGGSIDAKGRLAIQGNGSRDNTEIAISGNAKITGREAAIYHPQGGKLTISGGEVTGETGVIVKGGNVTISGGTITATGAAGAYEPVSSGFKGTGDALYVEHYDNSANSENYGTPTVTITGGTFVSANGQAVASYANPNGDVEALEKFISGGTFATKPNADYCAEGFTPVKVEGGYSVGILPDAEVTNLGSITVGLGDYTAEMYKTYDLIGGSGLQSAEVPYDLTLAMDFKAKDTSEAAAQNAFGNYTTDFFITMSGMSGESFVGKGCYLAGYYPSFNAWVKIPLDGFTVENGKVYPVITSAGFDFKYTDICGTVGQFICGIYLTPAVLEANPDLKVDLTLGLAENKDAALNAEFFKVDNYIYDADDLQPVTLPEVVITDIKNTLTDADPDLTFALNFAIKDVGNLSEEYLEKLFAKYGDYYTDYVLTISGLTDPNGSVKFNANGNGDGYLAGQYDAWSKSWVTVPFSDVTVKNGQSFYIMEYAAELMGKGGLRLTLKEIAEIVKNFDCGVYFTPEFLAANPNLKVDLELKVFTEEESGNKVGDISVATNTFDKDDFSVEAAKLDIRIVNGKPQIGFAGEGKLVLNAATALTGEWTKNVEYTAVENDGDDTKTWVTPKDGYYFFKGYIVR